jgi:pimeloyl-ACP methyl ester carboxylesterase
MRTSCLSLLLFAMTATISASPAAHERSREAGTLIIEPSSGKPRAVFVCLHGIQSNQTWWAPLGHALRERGFAVWAFNRPGSGAPAPVGPADLSSTSWPDQMSHLATQARLAYGEVPIIAMGVSWGASPAMVAACDPHGQWAGAVLCNPAFVTRKDCAFAGTVLLSYLCPRTWFNPGAGLHLPLTLGDYSPREETQRSAYLADANLKHTATRRFLTTTKQTKNAVVKLFATTRAPVLVLIGANDPLVPADRLRPLLEKQRAGNPRVELQTVPDATHAAIIESQHREYASRIVQWARSITREP